MAFTLPVCLHCAGLQCPPSWTLGPRWGCYLTSRWWLFVSGGAQQQHPNPLQAFWQLHSTSRDNRASCQTNGETEEGGYKHTSSFLLWSVYCLPGFFIALHCVSSQRISSLNHSFCIFSDIVCPSYIACDVVIIPFWWNSFLILIKDGIFLIYLLCSFLLCSTFSKM